MLARVDDPVDRDEPTARVAQTPIASASDGTGAEPSSSGAVTRAIARVTGWLASVFYELECAGDPVPDGPALIVANHPNALLDPLVVLRTAGRSVRPLAKAPLFSHPLIGPVLKGLGGLPVYRRRDDAALMHLNDRTFDAAIAALRGGSAVQIFPEGTSHSSPSLAPLRTGAARIALEAEARAGWSLGLRIVPVGLTYTRKTLFRSRALATVGAAFDVVEYRDMHASDPVAAVRALTARIAQALEALTLNLSTLEDREIIEVAERLYARSKVRGRSQRERLGSRLPRLRQFGRGLAWLRAHDPERHARLSNSIADYRRRRHRLGARDDDVPERYVPSAVASYVVRQGLALAFGFPLAALGLAFWYVPYQLPRLVVRLLPVTEDSVATYKLATALVLFPLSYVAWTLAAALYLGPATAVAVALLVPALGAFSLWWALRWERVKEDARVFFAVLRHPRTHDHLVKERVRITEEIDAVRKLIDGAE
jgi:glycerol-3-phosphate O-acyltransferase/dihydroxyacetone phosphate acyltransferase